MTPYVDRLRQRTRDRRSLLCAGIDPSPGSLSALFGDPEQVGSVDDRAREHAARSERLASIIVDTVRDRAVAVKPQAAWFELAGAHGVATLARVCERARNAGLLVVLDAKRGDVPHSMAGYADAYLGEKAGSGVHADALTVNAAIGGDALESAMRIALDRDAMVYALAHTSNPGARMLQDAPLASGGAWWHLLCATIDRAGAGAVVGATYPDALANARALMPSAPLLVPGIGSQGGSVASLSMLGAGLEPSAPPPTLIAVSRGLLPTPVRGSATPTDIAVGDDAAIGEHVAARAAVLADDLWRTLVPNPVTAG